MPVSTRKSLIPKPPMSDTEACAYMLLSKAFTINDFLQEYKDHIVMDENYCVVSPLKVDAQTRKDYEDNPFLLQKDRALHTLICAVAEHREKRLANKKVEAQLGNGRRISMSTLANAICQYHYETINAWARRRLADLGEKDSAP